MRIRPGGDDDRPFIRELSALVFARFGDYEATLPVMAARSDVHTLIVEAGGQRIGFAMYTLDGPEADLVAIAVLPERQSQGAGKLLLDEVESAVRDCAGDVEEAAVRLSVALDNTMARRLFERSGYRYRPEQQGVYPAGQPSIAMWKQIGDSHRNPRTL
jgi:ribosomal protein S18 acetylase RimI-like enzyme